MSLETTSKVDHEVVRPEGKTTGAITGKGWPGQGAERRSSPALLLPPSTPGCSLLSSYTLEFGMGQ